jgi:hypothetical protein
MCILCVKLSFFVIPSQYFKNNFICGFVVFVFFVVAAFICMFFNFMTYLSHILFLPLQTCGSMECMCVYICMYVCMYVCM